MSTATERTALYRLLGSNGRLLYVGISNNPDFRWGTHSNKQPWWDEVADRKIEWLDSREAAAAAEIEAIKEERPLYNKQHSVIGSRATVPSSITPPMEDPWADSGPMDRLPASRRHRDDSSTSELPQDFDAEQSVLGGMMRSGEAVTAVAGMLTVVDFYEHAHRRIYGAILGLRADGHPVDRITVAALLTKRGEITKAGGSPYLHTLVQSVPSAANAKFYAEIVYERAVMRRMIEAGDRLKELGRSFQDGGPAEMLRLARAELDAVAGPLRTRVVDHLIVDTGHQKGLRIPELDDPAEHPASSEETSG